MKKHNTGSKSVVKLTTEEVRHVADLAKLKLTDEEIEKYRIQLSSILEMVGKLKAVNTKGVEPTSQVTQLENVFREDEVEKERMLSQEEVLSNAKRKYNGYFVVKAIFEE